MEPPPQPAIHHVVSILIVIVLGNDFALGRRLLIISMNEDKLLTYFKKRHFIIAINTLIWLNDVANNKVVKCGEYIHVLWYHC